MDLEIPKDAMDSHTTLELETHNMVIENGDNKCKSQVLYNLGLHYGTVKKDYVKMKKYYNEVIRIDDKEYKNTCNE